MVLRWISLLVHWSLYKGHFCVPTGRAWPHTGRFQPRWDTFCDYIRMYYLLFPFVPLLASIRFLRYCGISWIRVVKSGKWVKSVISREKKIWCTIQILYIFLGIFLRENKKNRDYGTGLPHLPTKLIVPLCTPIDNSILVHVAYAPHLGGTQVCLGVLWRGWRWGNKSPCQWPSYFANQFFWQPYIKQYYIPTQSLGYTVAVRSIEPIRQR